MAELSFPQLGPFLFEYDGRKEMYISKGEEALAMVEDIWPDDWEAFVASIANTEAKTWRRDAEEALYMALPALGMHARGFSQEALIRACALVGSNPHDWTQYPETMEKRRVLLPERIQKAAKF